MPLVIAPCSRRKSPPPTVCAADLPVGPLEEVGQEWLRRLGRLELQEAAQLYVGRSARSAVRAAACLGADLLFASAGLGWISSDRAIPSYGLTVAAGGENILCRLSEPTPPTRWWQWINRHSPFASSLSKTAVDTSGLILVALPRAYLLMIETDLLDLPERVRARLRIIQRSTSPLDALMPWTVIYDDRLEGSDVYAGTRSDFMARAACHFVDYVLPGRESGGVSVHNDAVESSLSAWMPRVNRLGSRRSDDELLAVVRQHWDSAGGRTTQLLRVLRDQLGIACEQGRFARLVTTVRAEREQMR